MEAWIRNARNVQQSAIPKLQPGDVRKSVAWIPTHTDALVALLRDLPCPIDALRGLAYKKLADLSHTIESQAQLASVLHHAGNANIKPQPRESAVQACRHGEARWRISDDLDQ